MPTHSSSNSNYSKNFQNQKLAKINNLVLHYNKIKMPPPLTKVSNNNNSLMELKKFRSIIYHKIIIFTKNLNYKLTKMKKMKIPHKFNKWFKMTVVAIESHYCLLMLI